MTGQRRTDTLLTHPGLKLLILLLEHTDAACKQLLEVGSQAPIGLFVTLTL